MKKVLFALFLASISLTSFARSEFSAFVDHSTDRLVVTIKDDVAFPPFEAGVLHSKLQGNGYRKSIYEHNLELDCVAFLSQFGDTIGSCSFSIPMSLFEMSNVNQILKLSGSEAAKLNRYFTDSAYMTFQRGQAHLSSYNTRREFIFVIRDSLIQK